MEFSAEEQELIEDEYKGEEWHCLVRLYVRCEKERFHALKRLRYRDCFVSEAVARDEAIYLAAIPIIEVLSSHIQTHHPDRMRPYLDRQIQSTFVLHMKDLW
jgi:hypothetical protein